MLLNRKYVNIGERVTDDPDTDEKCCRCTCEIQEDVATFKYCYAGCGCAESGPYPTLSSYGE